MIYKKEIENTHVHLHGVANGKIANSRYEIITKYFIFNLHIFTTLVINTSLTQMNSINYDK